MRFSFEVWLRLLAVLLLASGFFAAAQPAAAQNGPGDAMIAYAMVKRPSERVIRREDLNFTSPTPYPRRGVVLHFFSPLSKSEGWIIVDFDARRVERLQTTTQELPDGEVEQIVDNKNDSVLSVAEVNTVIKPANQVWDPQPRRPARGAPMTDAMCYATLFDGDAVLHTMQFQYLVRNTKGVQVDADPLVKAVLGLKTGISATP